uniref:BCL-11A-like CCHC zinc finger domain-containing protein n=1 Tax=Periophthalmus magnuspinnatus TaxID=409849 RepID=A0A3B4B7Y2_9GOBI
MRWKLFGRSPGSHRHLEKRYLASDPEANHDPGAGSASPSADSSTPSPRRTGPGEHDLLTCGQCQTNFPLGDILVFIEHKRRLCRGLRSPPGSFSKPGEAGATNGLPISPRARLLELGRGPVEVGVQVSPGGDDEEERRLTPAKGICPKQDSLGCLDNLNPTSIACLISVTILCFLSLPVWPYCLSACMLKLQTCLQG